jgi:hypothetical protein
MQSREDYILLTFGQRVFDTIPIPGMFWGIPFTFALGILAVDETRKLIVRTYPKVSMSPFLASSLSLIKDW